GRCGRWRSRDCSRANQGDAKVRVHQLRRSARARLFQERPLAAVRKLRATPGCHHKLGPRHALSDPDTNPAELHHQARSCHVQDAIDPAAKRARFLDQLLILRIRQRAARLFWSELDVPDLIPCGNSIKPATLRDTVNDQVSVEEDSRDLCATDVDELPRVSYVDDVDDLLNHTGVDRQSASSEIVYTVARGLPSTIVPGYDARVLSINHDRS